MFAITADWHLGKSNIDEKQAYVESLVDNALATGADTLIVAGDIVDKSSIGTKNEPVGRIAKAILEPLFHNDEPKFSRIYFLNGNHDDNPKGSALEVFRKSKIQVITEPQIIYQYDHTNGIEYGLFMIPWMANHTDPDSILPMMIMKYNTEPPLPNGRIFTRVPVLIIHAEFPGALTPKGRFIPGGKFLLNIPLEQRKVFDGRIFAGHIHHRDVGIGYVGIPWQGDHRDEGSTTGYCTLDCRKEPVKDGRKIIGERVVTNINFVPTKFKEYRTVTTQELESMEPSTDVIKVRGSYKDNYNSKSKFPNISFEPEKIQNSKVREVLPPNASTSELLTIYHRITNETVSLEQAIAVADKLPTVHVNGQVEAQDPVEQIVEIGLMNYGGQVCTVNEYPAGLCGVIGRNGGGKSFNLEAPVTAAFGRLPSRSKSIYNYRLDKEKQGNIWCKVKTPKGMESFERTILDEDKQSRVFNGKKLSKESDMESEAKRIFGDYEEFLSSHLCTQKRDKDFTSMGASKRLETLSGWEELEHFEKLRSQVLALVAYKETELGIKEREYSGIKPLVEDLSVDSVNAIIQECDTYIHDLKEALALEEGPEVVNAITKLSSIKAEISGLNSALENTKKEKESKVTEIVNLQNHIKDSETSKEAFTEGLKNYSIDLYKDLESYEIQYNELLGEETRISSEITKLTLKIAVLSASRKPDMSMVESSGCKGSLSCNLIDGLKEQLIKWEQDQVTLQELVHDKITIDQSYKEAKTNSANKKIEYEEVKQKIDNMENCRRRIEALSGELTGLYLLLQEKQKTTDTSIIEKKKMSLMAQMASQIMFLKKNEISPDIQEYYKQINTDKSELRNTEYELNKYSTMLQNMQKLEETGTSCFLIKEELKVLQFLDKAFSKWGIPNLILDNMKPMLQTIISEIVEGLPYQVSFETTKETGSGEKSSFEILVTDWKGTRVFEDCSGGEKNLLLFLLRIAFMVYRKSKHKVMIVDELFDQLDPENKEIALGVLNNLLRWFNQVIVSSHDEDLINYLPNIIRI